MSLTTSIFTGGNLIFVETLWNLLCPAFATFRVYVFKVRLPDMVNNDTLQQSWRETCMSVWMFSEEKPWSFLITINILQSLPGLGYLSCLVLLENLLPICGKRWVSFLVGFYSLWQEIQCLSGGRRVRGRGGDFPACLRGRGLGCSWNRNPSHLWTDRETWKVALDVPAVPGSC